MRDPIRCSRPATAAMLVMLAPLSAGAQLPSASAAALGLGDNFTAMARGFNSLAWNPAGLAMPGGPRSSWALLSTRGVAGLDPVNASDLKEFEGRSIPAEIRREWLDRITTAGGEDGSAGADVTFLAASVGRVAVQASTTARAVSNLSPGAAELVLFGNAGRTGSPQSLSLEGSSMDVAVTSTLAVAYGHPLTRTDRRALSLGATLKYTVGHLMFTGLDAGSRIGADPIDVRIRFPVAQTDTSLASLNNGSGVGLDLGLSYISGAWSWGMTVRNVLNSFEWNEAKLLVRPGEALLNSDSTRTDFEAQGFSSAPAALRERVQEMGFEPELSAGVGYAVSGRVTVSADVRHRVGEERLRGPASHLGAGTELRLAKWLPVRLGGAIVSGGHQLSGGAGVEFGVVNLALGLASRSGELGTDKLMMFSFSSVLGSPKR